jgi:hypothetical protein
VALLLIFGGLVVSAEEVKVPLGAIKSSCYNQIDMSKAEFSLLDIGKMCVKDSWLEENLSEREAEETEPAKAESSEETEASSEKQKLSNNVKQIFYDVMGKTVNWEGKPETIREFSLIHYSSIDKYSLGVRYRASDNLTKGFIRTDIYQSAMNFIKKLYQDPANSKIIECHLFSYFTLVDKYGNESEEQVSKISLDREVAEKINWENMYYQKFIEIVKDEGSFYLHSALK